MAIKYFNNYCKCCSRKVLGRDLISVNMKLNGRNSDVFFCKKQQQKCGDNETLNVRFVRLIL